MSMITDKNVKDKENPLKRIEKQNYELCDKCGEEIINEPVMAEDNGRLTERLVHKKTNDKYCYPDMIATKGDLNDENW